MRLVLDILLEKKCNLVRFLSVILFCAPFVFTSSMVYADQKCTKNQSYLKNVAVPFINDIPYSAKPGLLKRFGTRVYERKSKPVLIDRTVFENHDKNFLVMGQSTRRMIDSNKPLELRLNYFSQIDSNTSFALLITDNDKNRNTFVYYHGNRAAIESGIATMVASKAANGSALSSETIATLANMPQFIALNTEGCDTFFANLPKALVGKNEISSLTWGVYFADSSTKLVEVLNAGVFYKKANKQSKFIKGMINDALFRSPSLISVDYENGKSRKVFPALNGHFIVEDEFPGSGIRISLKKQGHEYYPDQGRWLGVNRNVGNLAINIVNEYENIDGHYAEKQCLKKNILGSKIIVPEIKRPGHVLREWCGTYGRVQEFYNKYFVNQVGMFDQDFSSKPNNDCIRIAHLGHSSVEARHVSLHSKHNILASELLSIQLQKCVNIYTFEGDFSIVSEPRIDWIVENLKPDVMIFAIHRQMMQLTTPELLRHLYGYTKGNAHVESFDLLANGDLEYIPANPRAAFSKKVAPQPSIDKIPLSLSYNIPLTKMPNVPKQAFKTVEALLKRYHQKHPEMKLAMEYSHTIAECHLASYCTKKIDYKGKEVEIGADSYARNIHSVCKSAGVNCIDAPMPPPQFRGFPDLRFQYDAHYTKRGNYWQANNVFNGLKDLF